MGEMCHKINQFSFTIFYKKYLVQIAIHLKSVGLHAGPIYIRRYNYNYNKTNINTKRKNKSKRIGKM